MDAGGKAYPTRQTARGGGHLRLLALGSGQSDKDIWMYEWMGYLCSFPILCKKNAINTFNQKPEIRNKTNPLFTSFV